MAPIPNPLASSSPHASDATQPQHASHSQHSQRSKHSPHSSTHSTYSSSSDMNDMPPVRYSPPKNPMSSSLSSPKPFDYDDRFDSDISNFDEDHHEHCDDDGGAGSEHNDGNGVSTSNRSNSGGNVVANGGNNVANWSNSGNNDNYKNNYRRTTTPEDIMSPKNITNPDFSVGSPDASIEMAQYLDQVESSEQVHDICSFQDVDLNHDGVADAAERGEAGTNNNNNSSNNVASLYARARKRYYLLPMIIRYQLQLIFFLSVLVLFIVAIAVSASISQQNRAIAMQKQLEQKELEHESAGIGSDNGGEGGDRSPDDMVINDAPHPQYFPPPQSEPGMSDLYNLGVETSEPTPSPGNDNWMGVDGDYDDGFDEYDGDYEENLSDPQEFYTDDFDPNDPDNADGEEVFAYRNEDFSYQDLEDYAGDADGGEAVSPPLTFDYQDDDGADAEYDYGNGNGGGEGGTEYFDYQDEDGMEYADDGATDDNGQFFDDNGDTLSPTLSSTVPDDFDQILGDGTGDFDVFIDSPVPTRSPSSSFETGEASASESSTISPSYTPNPKWFSTSNPEYETLLNFDTATSTNSGNGTTSATSSANSPYISPKQIYRNAKLFCNSQDMELCTYEDYCPNGKSSDPFGGGPEWLDSLNVGELEQWSPVAVLNDDGSNTDGSNAVRWVQVGKMSEGGGDDNNNGRCWSYQDWSNGGGNEPNVDMSHMRYVLCCEVRYR